MGYIAQEAAADSELALIEPAKLRCCRLRQVDGMQKGELDIEDTASAEDPGCRQGRVAALAVEKIEVVLVDKAQLGTVEVRLEGDRKELD